MLQRAASNAYSWWWASHIRTKQSKWLEQSLQDMEEKVQYVLKLIEEDGDSFARRAEMYYKKRPELIHFVEESYRAYRALAERYDHISTELQNANTTIASVFPEQVQFAMDEEDEAAAPRFPKRTQDAPPQMNIPKVPKTPARDLKGLLTAATKKLQQNKRTKSVISISANAKSGLSKPEAIGQIDKLQKEILALQTEKEFVKSSYESAHGKYWEIEKSIKERQEQICSLQDEFGVSMDIDDDQARKLMTEAALKSCQETLDRLNEKHERSAEEARVEHGRVKLVREKLESLKHEFSCNEIKQESTRVNAKDESAKGGEESGSGQEEKQDLELLRKKIKEHLEVGLNASLSVTELAEKVDEIVNKVINLETEVSSQNALIKRLRVEADELQAQIRTMEDDKANASQVTDNISNKLRKMDERLHDIQDLEKSIEDKNNILQTHFIEARCNIDHFTELHSGKQDEVTVSSQTQGGSTLESESQKQPEVEEAATISSESFEKPESGEPDVKLTEAPQSRKLEEEIDMKVASQKEAESSPVEIKSEKFAEQKEAVTSKSDGFENMQTLKPDVELKVTDSLKREEGFPVEDRISSETESVKPDGELKVNGSLKKEEGFPDEDRISSESEIVKPDEKLMVTGPLGKEEVFPVEDRVYKCKTLEQLLNPGKSYEKARGAETEVNKDIKEHDSQCQEEGDKQTSTQKVDDPDEPNWREMFMNGMESKEKLILNEYTTVLRNYKEVKKKLDEVEKKSQDSLFQTTVQLSELKSANDRKDDKIRLLRQNLSLLQTSLDGDKDMKESKSSTILQISYLLNCNGENPSTGKEEDINEISVEQPQTMSEVEAKFRANIDELLEENLDFWLRFSTSFHGIQKFQTEIEDLQAEISKLDIEKKKNEGSTSRKHALRSDVRPFYKHLREIQTELTVWMEQSAKLKEELQCRFTSLCNIQEEITKALKESAEDDNFTFTSYQAAKFQGEILNMKQENNKVADELQAALDHVTTLQIEIDKTLGKLNEEFALSGSKNSNQIQQLKDSDSRSRVPLRSFIFGVKQKSQKPSFFSFVTPALHRKYRGLRSGAST